MTRTTRTLLTLSATLSLAACSAEDTTTPQDAATCEGNKCDAAGDDAETEDDRSVCVALRGNGDRIFSLIASLSRIVEHYGLLHGSAGGSSGSITTFITESIHLNPLLHECGDEACSDEEAAARAALLYKSTQGYFGVLSQSQEALALGTIAGLAAKIQETGLDAVDTRNPEAARKALTDLLESEDLRDLINPELVETLANSPDPSFHVDDFVGMAKQFGSFETTDPSILIRPGLVDFEAAAEKLGRVGSFYAAYEPVDREGMLKFMTHCATPGRGMNWDGVAALPAGDTTCGEMLAGLVTDFRKQVTEFDGRHPSRIDDPVGQGFHSLIPTSVLTGEAAQAWHQARDDYNNARQFEWNIDFADVKFGFFGAPEDLSRVEANPMGYQDPKTAKTIGLGQVSWREALTYSPAEPGIARALELRDGMVSAGGWPDLHPVLALKNIGCDEVVYVSRAGAASSFATGMAKVMNADEATIDSLYGLGEETGFGVSLAEADATWCTNWNDIRGLRSSGSQATGLRRRWRRMTRSSSMRRTLIRTSRPGKTGAWGARCKAAPRTGC